jgi:hypothetical protein
MNEERIGIALILSVIVWFAIVLARIIRSPGADEQ